MAKTLHQRLANSSDATLSGAIANVLVTFADAPRAKREPRRRVLGGKRGGLTWDRLKHLARTSPPPPSWYAEG